MNEMNVEPIDLGDEVRHGIDLRLALVPIVLARPILRELLHRRQLHALRSSATVSRSGHFVAFMRLRNS